MPRTRTLVDTRPADEVELEPPVNRVLLLRRGYRYCGGCGRAAARIHWAKTETESILTQAVGERFLE